MVSQTGVRPSSLVFSKQLPGASGEGFTLVELLVVIAVIGLLASMAIYNVLRARTTANETAAIGNLRTLVNALETYHTSNVWYPDDWQTDLYDNTSLEFGPPAFRLSMDASEHQGYLYTYTPVPTGCSTTCSGYTISSVPQTTGLTGSRAFFVNETGIIRHCIGEGPADAHDQPIHLAPASCN